MSLGIAFKVSEPATNNGSRSNCTGKRKRCKRSNYPIVEVRVKNVIFQCPKNNASHVIKVFVRHILKELVAQVYSNVLH